MTARLQGAAGRVRPVALGVLALTVSALALTGSVGAASASTGPAASPAPVVPSGCNPNGQARFEASKQLPPRQLQGYTRIYCDDFRGSGLTRGWVRFQGQPSSDPGAMFQPSHVVQSGGVLQINTYRDPSFGDNWVTGGLCQCAYAQTYGAYFVRSRVTGGGDDNDELLWPYQHIWPPEIDFNETTATTSRTGAYVHFDPRNNQIAHLLSINLMSWHTWGVIWTPTVVVFTVDGHVWGRVTDPAAIPRVPMTLDLQEQTYCYNGAACPTHPVSLLVDWVAEFALNR